MRAHRRERPAQRLAREELRDVDHSQGEALGALAPGGIAGEEKAVGLHVGAAARGVHDDPLDPRGLEGLDGPLREVERGRVLAGVGVQRAAAGLRARRQHLDAVLREHARGGSVLRAEGHLLDAAGQEPDGGALGPLGGGALGQRRAVGRRGQGRQQGLPRGERARGAGGADRSRGPAAAARSTW